MGLTGYSTAFSSITLLLALFLGLTSYVITSLSSFLGLTYFIQTNDIILRQNTSRTRLCTPNAAKLIQDILPVVKYKELDVPSYSTENCAVCLSEFEAETEIRWLKNCKHIFHTACLNRWMDHDRDTCPLCRKSLIPDEMQEEFHQRLWHL